MPVFLDNDIPFHLECLCRGVTSLDALYLKKTMPYHFQAVFFFFPENKLNSQGGLFQTCMQNISYTPIDLIYSEIKAPTGLR